MGEFSDMSVVLTEIWSRKNTGGKTHFITKLGEQQLRKEQAAGAAAIWLFEREVSLSYEYVTEF